MCAVSRWVPSCYVMCLTVQRDVCCEQMSPIILCNVFDCVERCLLWTDQSHHAVVFDCAERCVLWTDQSHHAVVFDCAERCVLWADQSHHAVVFDCAERCVLSADQSHHAVVFDCAERCACILRADQSVSLPDPAGVLQQGPLRFVSHHTAVHSCLGTLGVFVSVEENVRVWRSV